MPLGDDHFDAVVVSAQTTTQKKKTEESKVAGGKAPSGYMETFAAEVPKAAQQAANTAGKAMFSAINPIHYKDNGDVDTNAVGMKNINNIDLEASAVHLLGDVGAYQLGKMGIKRAFAPNPLDAQVAATLKTSNDQILNAAAQRAHDKEILAAKQAHEIELQKLKAAGVPAKIAAPVATALTTPAPNAQAQAITLAEFNAAKAATAPPAGTPLNPVAAPQTAIQTIEEIDAERARLDADHEARMKEHNRLFPSDSSLSRPLIAPETPTVPLSTEVGKEPAGMGLVKAGEENKLKNELAKQKTTPANPFEGATELKTGTGKSAFEGMNPEGKMRSTYPSIRDVPQGKAFIPNAQYIDVLRNDLGQPTYTQSFTGRDFPTEYKGSIETGKEINRSLGRETRAQLEARGVPHEQMPEPTKGILERVGGPKGSKVIKVGGVAGALISLADLAKAENLRQGVGNVAEGLLPIGMTSSELAPGTLTEKQLKAFQEAQKLGSPYRSVPPPR
jgi:hypothetical protein